MIDLIGDKRLHVPKLCVRHRLERDHLAASPMNTLPRSLVNVETCSLVEACRARVLAAWCNGKLRGKPYNCTKSEEV